LRLIHFPQNHSSRMKKSSIFPLMLNTLLFNAYRPKEMIMGIRQAIQDVVQ
jgi:hypothetical protein